MSKDYFFLGSKLPDDDQNTQLDTILYNYGLGGNFSTYWVEGYQYESDLKDKEIEIYESIERNGPSVIIALGTACAEFLIGNKYISLGRQSGKLMNCVIKGKEYPLIITYSVNYALGDKSSEEIKSRFISDILQSIKFVNGEISQLKDKKLTTVLTYQEFISYYETYLKNKSIISYDIETNAQLIHSEWFKTIGFSLSGDSNSGVYVVREALEHTISAEEWSKITELLVQILKSHRIIVHNSMYEIPAAVNEYGYRLENWEDTLAMARLLLGGQTGAGLKEQCQDNLGYPEWEEDLTIYRESMDQLRQLFKPTDSGVERSEFTELRDELDGDLTLLRERHESYINNAKVELKKQLGDEDYYQQTGEGCRGLSHEEYLEELKKLDKNRSSRLVSSIRSIEELVQVYYQNSEEFTPESIIKLVGKELVNLVESSEYGFLPYSSIPLNILSKYGAIDAVGTFELYEKLSYRISEESTPEVDLWKGYDIVKSQLEVATSMEMAGMYWNDEVAQSEQDWFNEHACEAMKNMLLSGFLDNNIFWNCRPWWIDYLMEYDKDELVKQLGFDYVLTELGIKKFVDGEVKGREIRKWKIPDQISEEYWSSVKDQLIRYAKIKILSEPMNYFDQYKDIYNPASPGQAKVLNPILVTEDVKVSMILQMVYLIIDDANRDTDKEFPYPDKDLFKMLKDFRLKNKDIEDWNEEYPEFKKPKITNREIFDNFKTMIGSTVFRSSELNGLIKDGLNYELSSGDEPSMIEIYHLYQLLGFDIEDEFTWNESFRFLYNFRMYKKCIKMINSYITGSKLGRGMVTVVNNKDLDKPMPKRVGWYDDRLKSNQSYLMESSFGPCTANSLRWRCIHPDTVIPLMDGSLPTVKELAGLDEFWVYSYDQESKRIVPGHAHHARISNNNADIYEVFLDNGKSFRATGNHPVLVRNGSYVNVEDLKSGTSLMPLYRRDSYKHGLAPGGYEEIYYPELNTWELTCYSSIREYLGVDPDNGKGYQVHHSDFDKTNNTPTNLEFLTEKEHLMRHSGKGYIQWAKMNPELYEKKLQRDREVMISRNQDPECQARCQEGRKKFFEDPERSRSFREAASKNGHNTWYRRFDTAYNKAKELCKQFGRIDQDIYNQNKYERDLRWETMCKRLEISSEELTSKIESEVFYNCKVLKVEYVGKSEVYDITVDKYHNFAISLIHGKDDKVWSGIFTHNSGFHTIPSTSSIKNIYTSRYKGGVIFAPDYSQNEVRAIAAVSHCEPMLKAFREGADIHRQNAAAIWKKKPEDVTSVERRYAKMSTFCMTGDTKVRLLDNRVLSFKEMYDLGEEYDTISINESGKIVANKSSKVQITGYVNELVEIILDNGMTIKCTPNHKFMLRNGSYQEAQDLLEGQSLMPLYMRLSEGWISGYYEIYNPNTGNYEFLHRLLNDQLSPDQNVSHYINHNPLDNRPSNLKAMSHHDHYMYHFSLPKPQVSKMMIEEGKDWFNSRQYRGLLNNHKWLLSQMKSQNIPATQYSEVKPAEFIRESEFERVLGITINDLYDQVKIIRDSSELVNLFELRFKSIEVRKLVDSIVGIYNLQHPSEKTLLGRSDRMSKMNSSEEIRRLQEKLRIDNKIYQVIKKYGYISSDEYNSCRDQYRKELGFSKIPTLSNIEYYWGSWDILLNHIRQYLPEVKNHKVKRVRLIKLEELVPVYDFETNPNHNFAIVDPNDSLTGVFVHNSLLYGDSPEGFANKFLAGDVSLGRQIFHDFYEAYPTILDWVHQRYDEWRRTGKVSCTLTGMFLACNDSIYGDEARTDRVSQNSPIQSQSSNIAGYTLASVDRFLRENNMLTRTILFIHDSLEFDVHPNEMLYLAKKIIDIMMDVPNNKFDFLAKVDLEIGISLGQGLEATDVQMNEDHTEGSMVIEGKLSNFEAMLSVWKLVYQKVDYEYLEEPEKIYVPRGDLFVPKLTLSKNFGTYEQMIKAKVYIKY